MNVDCRLINMTTVTVSIIDGSHFMVLNKLQKYNKYAVKSCFMQKMYLHITKSLLYYFSIFVNTFTYNISQQKSIFIHFFIS